MEENIKYMDIRYTAVLLRQTITCEQKQFMLCVNGAPTCYMTTNYSDNCSSGTWLCLEITQPQTNFSSPGQHVTKLIS